MKPIKHLLGTKSLGLVLAGLFIASQAFADVGSGIFVDQSYANQGQSGPQFSATVYNDGVTPVAVDLHIGVLSPSGVIYEFPGWVPNALTPVVSNIAVPPNFNLPITPLGALPVLTEAGVWTAFAVMTSPGTLEILSLEMAPVNVLSASPGGSSFGALTFNYSQAAGGVTVDAGGAFIQSDVDLEQAFTAYQGEQPGLEQCVFNTIPIDFGSLPQLNFITLDAGNNINLSGSGVGTVPLSKDPDAASFGYVLYAAAEGQPAQNFYQGGVPYTFQGFGGPQVSAFSVSLTAPAPLNLIQPDVNNPLAAHNTATDLPLTWDGNNGVGEVSATLSGSDFSNSYTIECRFVDDGSASVPANLLTQLRDSLGSGGGGFPIPDIPDFDFGGIPGLGGSASLNVSRNAYTVFSTSGLSFGVVEIDAGASMSLTLE